VYLGGVISADSSCDEDVARRIGTASGVVRNLDDIWKSKEITADTKVKLYQSLLQSALLYNSETWTIKEEHKRKLRVFEMAVLRRICGVTRQDRIRNVDEKKYLNIKNDIQQCYSNDGYCILDIYLE